MVQLFLKISTLVFAQTTTGNYTTSQRKGKGLTILIRVPTSCVELLYDGFESHIKCSELQEEIKRNCYLHKRSLFKGYLTRKTDNVGSYVTKIYRYNGRYGKGYAIFIPNWNTRNYVYVEYWIERKTE